MEILFCFIVGLVVTMLTLVFLYVVMYGIIAMVVTISEMFKGRKWIHIVGVIFKVMYLTVGVLSLILFMISLGYDILN